MTHHTFAYPTSDSAWELRTRDKQPCEGSWRTVRHRLRQVMLAKSLH